jgi:hypothetical protein
VISPLGCDADTYYYSLILTVTDTAGLSTSREVRLYPDCPELPFSLKYLGRDETQALRWQLTGDSNRTYMVQASTNLFGWSDVTTVQPTGGMAEFSDPPGENPGNRFYRAILVP